MKYHELFTSEKKDMLKSEIKALLKEENQNDEITWNVTTNRKNLIDLYCNYSESHFQIVINKDGDIEVKDELMECTVIYLLKGNKWYHDFQNEDDGIIKAINAIFSYFYSHY